MDSEGCKVSSRRQRRLKTICEDAQADLSLRWAHILEGTFSSYAAHINQELRSRLRKENTNAPAITNIENNLLFRTEHHENMPI